MAEKSTPNVVDLWQKETSAAFTLAARTAELGHWAFQLAGTRTILCCADIVSDLVHHAELAREVADAAGGSVEGVRVDADALSILHRQGHPLVERALAFTADQLCTEVTVRLARHRAMLDVASVEPAERALERFVTDGERHVEMGYLILEGLLTSADDETRIQARDDLEGWIDRVLSRHRADEAEVTEREAAWGAITSERAAEVVEDAVEKELRPAFEARLPSS
jgi:hypothetical protein